jgi:NAD-dependent deacetylase
MDTEKIRRLQNMIDTAGNIVFFGGAGVSTESGIPDFRSADGIYMMDYKYPPEEIISHSFFLSHPKEFFEFYRQYFYYPDAVPNAAHKKLAELETKGKNITVVTQNIDGLHTDAGSKKVYELHGSVLRNYCMKCGKFYDVEYVAKSTGIPKCSCGGTVKPDVVLYEEPLDGPTIEGAVDAISKADLLIVAGTSLRVYPAAGFIRYFKGSNLAIINKERTDMDGDFSLVIHDKVGEVLSAIKA